MSDKIIVIFLIFVIKVLKKGDIILCEEVER